MNKVITKRMAGKTVFGDLYAKAVCVNCHSPGIFSNILMKYLFQLYIFFT